MDFLHKATTDLAITESVILVEDLSAPGMIGNRHPSRSIADAAWSECRRMLAYQTQWYGSQLVVARRFHPATKTCLACGHIKEEMPLGERVFHCEVCGAGIDRDLNAARNLASLVAGSSPETPNASGQENGLVKPVAVQQESPSPKLAAQAVGNKLRAP
jgi:putative transposase